MSEDAAVSVSRSPLDPDFLAEDELGECLLGFGAVCLGAFGGVDSFEADFVRAATVEDGNGIAVGNADNFAREGGGLTA